MMRSVPIVNHYDLDATLSEIIDHVLNKAVDAIEHGVSVEAAGDDLPEKAAGGGDDSDDGHITIPSKEGSIAK
jgi:hypothetical protein